MPAPKPLTEMPAASIDWSRTAAPAAQNFGDIYFSVDGGLDETQAVFLKGCGLPEDWQGKSYYAIGETGFGTGLNFLATWQLWQTAAPKNARLDFISVEKYPLDRQQLARALASWPQLGALAAQLIERWPGRVRGVHRLEFGRVSLTLIHDDAADGLAGLTGRVNAWYLDGFSPSKNPAMWSSPVMNEIARLSAHGARLASFTVAGAVREALASAGFVCEKKPGFGRKRQRLEARFEGEPAPSRARAISPLIIGSGIAGASLARSFQKRGVSPLVIDADDGRAASANPAAIVKPRLDLQDRPESRFFLASFLYARCCYQDAGAIEFEGVYHIAKTEKQAARFDALAQQKSLPLDQMHLVKNPFGEAIETDAALYFPKAQIIDPMQARRTFLGGCRQVKGRVATAVREGPIWQALGANGEVLGEGTDLIWAAGAGVRDLDIGLGLASGLRFSRGQISWAENRVDGAITYGGYAIPMGQKMLLGATHDRAEQADPYALRDEDDQRNLAAFIEATQLSAALLDLPSRASVRVTTPSTLPVIKKLAENAYMMTGLGSRGFVFAPLLAESFAAQILGEAAALPRRQQAVLCNKLYL